MEDARVGAEEEGVESAVAEDRVEGSTEEGGRGWEKALGGHSVWKEWCCGGGGACLEVDFKDVERGAEEDGCGT